MNNEYLRLQNNDLKTDKTVNIYSAKHSKRKKDAQNSSNSAISILIDEVYGVGETPGLITEEVVKKPKILDTIIFSFIFLLVIMAVVFISSFLKDLVLVLCLTVLLALFIPVSLLYFFSRLDVRGKIKFSSLIYFALLGAIFYVIVEFVFNSVISQALHSYLSVIALRCLIELVGVFIISTFLIRSKVNCSRTTVILITSAVSAGFAIVKALYSNFSSLLIDVDIQANLDLYEYGMRVGAILNYDNFIEISLQGMLSQAATSSFMQPVVFMLVAVIFLDILETDNWSFSKKTMTSIFAFVFCLMTYILMSIQTPFSFLAMLYKILSIIFVLYLFAKMVNDCIKSESYE